MTDELLDGRFVRLRNAWNLRDLGGYRSITGHRTKWRQVYRSDTLARLDESEVGLVRDRGVGLVIDLRRPSELELDGWLDLGTDVAFRNISVQPAAWPLDERAAGPGSDHYLADRYVEMVERSPAAFGEALSAIGTSGETPVIFYCLGGKDRTGVLSALLLWIAGVPDELIARDYALSDLARPATEAWIRTTDQTTWASYQVLPDPFKVAPAGAMLRFLQRLRSEFGDSTTFTEEFGLDQHTVEGIKAKLLA